VFAVGTAEMVFNFRRLGDGKAGSGVAGSEGSFKWNLNEGNVTGWFWFGTRDVLEHFFFDLCTLEPFKGLLSPDAITVGQGFHIFKEVLVLELIRSAGDVADLMFG
jgi:hypothetical protein